jgi:Ribbon-helix-helix protein, copG family
MVAERLEVRLDQERKRKLEELAQDHQSSVSETVRKLIDRAHNEYLRERRIEAARQIGELEIEDVPDPDELSRQLAQTHDIGDLY